MQRKELGKKVSIQDASRLTVGIVLAEFNPDITESLLEGALATLHAWKVSPKNIKIFRVYGSFDLPHAVGHMLKKHKPNAVIALGCIIKGETDHDRYIASAVTHGLTDLTIKYGTPVSLGILTTNNLAQARVRSRGKTNHGEKAAVAALQSAFL
jgi:6,7-dimethyl-8-ribityllumazine synthase